ncbi:MAG: ABC transporter ATP-binding protein [Deltaproteobacteria bacterium]|nr:ABC transporter ATP-binding protein [Deltaproteobacteria bacterium]
MSFLRIENLYKTFGGAPAVDRINLEIQEGEFFTLLGSSGCGKTTTLRMVGGLERPDSGAIYLGDQCLVSAEKNLFIKPEKRNMGMVFQSYALWPHMTVFENVAYPLKLRGIRGSEAQKKVADVLGLVGLGGLEERQAPALSGGQQQRVALARALVFSPKVLLLDEPLSNLDAQLREEMRRELKALRQRVNVTVIFVTHDQVEALSLSDRIAIMKFGVLEQVGTPEQVYYQPATPFVRDFLGKTFLLAGKVTGVSEQQVRVEVHGVGASALTIERAKVIAKEVPVVGQPVMVAIRPEKMVLSESVGDGEVNVVEGTLRSSQFLGDRYEYTVTLGAETRVIVSPEARQLKPGGKVFLELMPNGMTLWPAE